MGLTAWKRALDGRTMSGYCNYILHWVSDRASEHLRHVEICRLCQCASGFPPI